MDRNLTREHSPLGYTRDIVSERFAYWAFLTVLFTGLLAMTVCLAAIAYFLLRQNRSTRGDGSGGPPGDARQP